MLSSDDTTYNTSTNPIIRSSRAASRREIINEKRHKNTDILPKISSEMTNANGRTTARQVTYLREENKRLRWELDELQRQILYHKNAQAQLEKEIDSIHRNHQQVIEQYEMHLREAIDERNQLQKEKWAWEQRYQDLYHTFHENVAEEATKMVEEAAQTLVLSPEHTPPLLRDVAKTLEFQVKQTEDQHVAQLLTLMRQAQYKAALLERELANEREKISAERQVLLIQQNSIREKAQYRYKTLERHLKAHWTLTLALMAAVLLILVSLFQLLFFSMHLALGFALFAPIVIGVGLAFLFARIRTNSSFQQATQKLDQKTTTVLANPSTPAPGSKKV